MADHVDTDTLRQWLELGHPVTVLDVRSDEDRAQWAIPSSVHINVYEALKANTSGVLDDLSVKPGIPVVTVCNFGRMSDRAADLLAARGVKALSLTGGMKAWSLAWNTAEFALSNARVVQVRRTGKGCLSYLLVSGSDAVVVDASLPPEVYLTLAKKHGVRIRFVMDTHIHADHLSRSRSLSEAAGAELFLPAQERVRFSYRPLSQGSVIEFAAARLEATATPGHTNESMSYVLDGEAVLTGDTLFPASIGRPDLHADAHEARERASLLFQSLNQLTALGPDVLVLSGHASEPVPFDGRPISERMSVVAEHLEPWLKSESEFIERILSRVPATPPNFERIVELNESGILPDEDPTELEAGANRCAVSEGTGA
jgi:glyoxylase-like metal-dependent hydrolase (beta-lactamase superfamily II)